MKKTIDSGNFGYVHDINDETYAIVNGASAYYINKEEIPELMLAGMLGISVDKLEKMHGLSEESKGRLNEELDISDIEQYSDCLYFDKITYGKKHNRQKFFWSEEIGTFALNENLILPLSIKKGNFRYKMNPKKQCIYFINKDTDKCAALVLRMRNGGCAEEFFNIASGIKKFGG